MVKMTAIFNLALAGLLLGAAVTQAAVLESPARGATLSGLGFISGWKCDASNITVVIDENGEHLSVAMHQERGDLRRVCGGTIRHGFIKQFNWALLGDGEHVVVAYDDGVEFARATFTEDQRTGAYTTDEELYAERPDLDRCVAGRLSQAAKNRALEATNQIRALHGLTPLVYSTLYSQQMQAAALIQAAAGYPGHRPDPSADCYTAEGAEGSGTSNLFGGAGNRDPADHMVGWANDFNNRSQVSAVGHRRWVLNPFAFYFAYGQVHGYAAHKVVRYDREPRRAVLPEVDFVAFPYETYPYHLVEGDPPWSISVIEDPDNWYWGNRYDYFQEAAITVTRVKDETALPISDRYTDSWGFALPNILSWQVEGWEYDTLYEVEISNVSLQSGLKTSYSYSVFIERDNLEE